MLLQEGLRAVAYVDTMQCILLAGGIIALGLISFYYIGGLSNLTEGIISLTQSDTKLNQGWLIVIMWLYLE